MSSVGERASPRSFSKVSKNYDFIDGLNVMICHNLDFSSFPLLLECVYKQLTKMDQTFGKNIPFCAFQHVYVGILNALLLERGRIAFDALLLVPEDMCIPLPIAQYYELVADLQLTDDGAMIFLNVPEAGVPRFSIPATKEHEAIPPGSFGPVTAQNHNAYECYVSPYITHRLIEATIDQKRRQRSLDIWQPLPFGAYPLGAVPNENLLGYRKKVEKVSDEVYEFISRLKFAASNDTAGRLRWCPELVDKVSTYIRDMDDCHTLNQRPPAVAKNTNLAVLGLICVHDTIVKKREDMRLSTLKGHLYSPVTLSMSQCSKVAIFGLKRKRCLEAMGLCYSYLHTYPKYWDAFMNANLKMRGDFKATEPFSEDRRLRKCKYNISALPTRDKEISNWVRKISSYSASEDSDNSEDLMHCCDLDLL